MPDKEFDFSLPSTEHKEHPKSLVVFMVMLLVVQALTLCAVVFLPREGLAPVEEAVKCDKLQDYAMKLEELGLAREASDAWLKYIAAVNPDPEKEAKLHYRIGVIQQNGRLYEEALASFYRSEMLAKVPSLELEITRRTGQCLEALGKATAIRRNLEERTSVGAGKDETPMVEIGGTKISRKDLEAMAEAEVDMMLNASGMDDAQKMAYKKDMLNRKLQGDGLKLYARQFVSMELLYRAAVEEKLGDDPSVRDAILKAERGVLTQEYIRRKLATVSVSDADISDYYAAHPDAFTDKAGVRLAHVLFKDAESAEAAMKSLVGKQEFEEIAKSLSNDKTTAEKGGELPGWITSDDKEEWRKQVVADVLADAGKCQPGTVLTKVYEGNGWHIVKVLEKRDARLKELNEVKEKIRPMLTERKTGEIYEAVLKDLSSKYGVVWHAAAEDAGGAK